MDDQQPADAPVYHDLPPQHRLSTRGRRLSWIAGLIGLVLVVLLAVWLSHRASGDQGQGARGGGRGGARSGGRGGPGGVNQPTTVGTAKVVAATLPVTLDALGTITPTATVTVRPQVSGTITQILYREGQLVRRGQVLAVVDPRPFQATLLQAQGNLMRDQAQLTNAQLQLQRYQTLLKQDSIARQDVDTQAALARQLQGTITADRGAVDQARINLGFTRIVAQVAGRIGLRIVDVGNYVGAGDTTGIAVVTTLQPIDAEFSVPQQQVPAVQQRLAQGAEIPAIALDSTRTRTLAQGRFVTLDNQVDTATGTVKAKARFANADFQLYPSEFVNVRLTVNTVANAVTVPPAAVRSGPNGSFVWVLQPDRTVKYRAVKTGVAEADRMQVTDGLKIGETVVTDGGDRLSEGSKVALPGDKPQAGAGGATRKGGSRRGG